MLLKSEVSIISLNSLPGRTSQQFKEMSAAIGTRLYHDSFLCFILADSSTVDVISGELLTLWGWDRRIKFTSW